MDLHIFSKWHILVLHFPIVLFIAGLIFDFLDAVFKLPNRAGHWDVFAAVLFTIPTVITGWGLTPEFSHNPYFDVHRAFGLATLIYGLLHGAIRWYLVYVKKILRGWIFVSLSLTSCILIVITADTGGLMAFGFGFLKFIQHA